MDEPHFVINVLVEVFIWVSINVLGIMDREVDTALQDQYIVLVGEINDSWVNHYSEGHTYEVFAYDVDKVPLATITLIDFKFKIYREQNI